MQNSFLYLIHFEWEFDFETGKTLPEHQMKYKSNEIKYTTNEINSKFVVRYERKKKEIEFA